MRTTLTEKQEAFCAEYALTRNGSASYRKAYNSKGSSKSTEANARKLLRDTRILTRIEELKERVHAVAAEKFDLTAEKLLAHITKIAFCDAGDFYNWSQEGVKLKASDELTPDQRRMVSHVQQKKGKETTIQVQLIDKAAMINILCKHLGVFELDNAQRGANAPYLVAEDGAV